MTIMRWNPLQEIELLQRDMNHLINVLVPSGTNSPEKTGFTFTPPAEMTETAEAVHLKFEVPGLEAQDFDIEATADSLTVRGERKSQTTTEREGVTRTEFRYGKFSRSLSLPARIETTQVSAQYKDGVLHITLPKAETEKHKVVKVNVN